MKKELVTSRSIQIKADADSVWKALTDKETIKKYFFGTEAISDWKEGSTLVFQGEWEGKPYQDKGHILAAEPGKLLRYDYWSAFTGLEDSPENYSLVTYHLEAGEGQTTLSLTQQGFVSAEALAHAKNGWKMVLENLQNLLEKGA